MNQLDINYLDNVLGLTTGWDIPTVQLQSDLDLKIGNYTIPLE